MAGPDVDDAASENIHKLTNLTTAAVLCADLHQHQVALNVIRARKVLNTDNGHNLCKLFTDLIQLLFIFVDDERDP